MGNNTVVMTAKAQADLAAYIQSFKAGVSATVTPLGGAVDILGNSTTWLPVFVSVSSSTTVLKMMAADGRGADNLMYCFRIAGSSIIYTGFASNLSSIYMDGDVLHFCGMTYTLPALSLAGAASIQIGLVNQGTWTRTTGIAQSVTPDNSCAQGAAATYPTGSAYGDGQAISISASPTMADFNKLIGVTATGLTAVATAVDTSATTTIPTTEPLDLTGVLDVLGKILTAVGMVATLPGLITAIPAALEGFFTGIQNAIEAIPAALEGFFTGIQSAIEAIPAALAGVFETVVGAVEAIPAALAGVFGNVIGAITGIFDVISADFAKACDSFTTFFDLSIPLDFAPLEVSFASKFPFCIPWDLVNVFKGLVAPAIAPTFLITFPAAVGLKGYSFTFDFSHVDLIVVILRYFLLIEFIIGLIKLTRVLIKG